MLIEQEKAKIEVWTKLEENVWRITNVKELDEKIKLQSLDCEILMADIYYLIEGVK